MTTIQTTRRNAPHLTLTAAAVPVAVLPTIPELAAEPDPIFAAIEAHKITAQEELAAIHKYVRLERVSSGEPSGL